MSSLVVIALVCCVQVINGVVGQNNDVCLSLPRNPVDVNQRKLQGPPGKRGAVGGVGPKGDQGQKGEPGDVESCGCKPGDIDALKEQVHFLRSCFDGIIYYNQCIRFPYTRVIQNTKVTFVKAQEICNNMNSSLTEISSERMYDAVYTYVLQNLVAVYGSQSFVKDFWIGSTFEPTNNPNNLVTLRNGTRVRLTKWDSSYPGKGSSSQVNLLMRVNSRLKSNDQDLWNQTPNGSGFPLCSQTI